MLSSGPRVSWKLCTSCPERSLVVRKMEDRHPPTKDHTEPTGLLAASEPRPLCGASRETAGHLLLLFQRWQTLVPGFLPQPPHRTGCSGAGGEGRSWHRTGCSGGAGVRGTGKGRSTPKLRQDLKDKIRSPPDSWEILNLGGGSYNAPQDKDGGGVLGLTVHL